jgi:hypothetical protein
MLKTWLVWLCKQLRLTTEFSKGKELTRVIIRLHLYIDYYNKYRNYSMV